MATPVERIAVLDDIEKNISSVLQYASQALQELSKDKPANKQVEGHTQQFIKTLTSVEIELSKQISYLTQVSTGQAHEGSSYNKQKELALAMQRAQTVRDSLGAMQGSAGATQGGQGPTQGQGPSGGPQMTPLGQMGQQMMPQGQMGAQGQHMAPQGQQMGMQGQQMGSQISLAGQQIMPQGPPMAVQGQPMMHQSPHMSSPGQAMGGQSLAGQQPMGGQMISSQPMGGQHAASHQPMTGQQGGPINQGLR